MTSFGVELDQRQEEEGSNEMCQGAKKEGSGWLCRGKKAALLADPVTQLLELPFMKNVLVVLGEKFEDPQEEGLFLDVN